MRDAPGQTNSGDRLLAVALAVLLVAVWLEPAGSWLSEPDEARYAEIPREMLGSGDFVTPRLNGVPYFEKPPLLYWANAASFALFGESPWSARLPTRLAGTATALLLVFGLGRLRSRREGLAAAVFYLAAPLSFASARMNLTDGVLTFFFAATLFTGLAALRRAAEGRPTAGVAALAGALAAGGFLSKGLIAIALPGAILLAWAILARRARDLLRVILSPAIPVFLLLATPWLLLAERAHPGFLRFFLIHEHFQRFATVAASRPGPIYYFAALFLAGFLPALPFFFPGIRAAGRRDPVGLFFLVWFLVVFLFFSISRSKLPPYLFPALPAAAALSALGFASAGGSRRTWTAHAILAAVLLAACTAVPEVRREVASRHLEGLALFGAAALLTGAVVARLAKPAAASLAAAGLGWAGLYAALAFAWPRIALATDVHELAAAARVAAASRAVRVAAESRATRVAAESRAVRIVSYKTYLQGFPWELGTIVPLAEHRGELEDWWLPEAERREIFWTGERFWSAWRAGRVVALVRDRALPELPGARVLLCRGKYCVAASR